MSRSELLQLGRSSYGIEENCWLSSSRSGTIAAGAGALSIFWAQQLPTAADAENPIVIERLRLSFTCLTAFTTPVTAGRSLAFCTLDGLPTLGGVSNIMTLLRKQNLSHAQGADGQVAMCNTTPFAPTGAVPSLNDVFATLSLAGFGASGNTVTHEWLWDTGHAAMLGLVPGTVIALIAPVAMDAAGTFEVTVESDVQGLPIGYPVA